MRLLAWLSIMVITFLITVSLDLSFASDGARHSHSGESRSMGLLNPGFPLVSVMPND